MKSDLLTAQAHARLRNLIARGDTVIDATAGNGFDTLFLAGLVAEPGRVFAIDKQQAAIDSARARLQQAGLDEAVTWLCMGHESMLENIPLTYHGKITAIMFNLGYLPGGDKSDITQTDTTLIALQQAYELLKPGGVLSVIAYKGHTGGRTEAEAIMKWAEKLSSLSYEVTIPVSKHKVPPEWFLLIKE